MKLPYPSLRGSLRHAAFSARCILLATLVSVPAALATPQFSLVDVWTAANSDLGGSAGPEPHFVYAIGVDWRDHVLVACEGRYDQSGGDGGEKNLLVRISRDHGVSWDGDYVIEGASDTLSWTNPAFVIDGTTTYLFYSGSLTGSGKQIFYRTITQTFSNGAWNVAVGPRTELTSLWGTYPNTRHGWFVHGTIGHGIKKLKSPNQGRLILPVAHRTADPSSAATALYGNDMLFKDPAGAWSIGTVSETPLEQETDGDPSNDVGAGESRIAERADGSLVLFARKIYNFLGTTAHPEYRPRMRAAGNSQANSIVWNNWVNAQGVTGTIKCDGGLLRFSDTTHLYSFSNNEGHSERLNMAVRFSSDGGVTWPGSPKEIYGGDHAANYSDLARDSLGNIYCVFGRDGGSHNHLAGARVTVAKFNLEWVNGIDTPTIVIDNGAAGFTTTGTWNFGASVDGCYGSDYVTASQGTATATWTPTILSLIHI